MEDNKKKIIEWASIGFCIVFLIIIYRYMGCPFRFFLGICCPGCGMTRALIAIVHGNIQKALYYHPLFILLPPMGALIFFRNRFDARTKNIFLSIILGIFILVWVVRILDPGNNIVYFRPSSGMLYNMYKLVKNTLF